MPDAVTTFQRVVRQLAHDWQKTGLPSRQVLDQAADALVEKRRQLSASGIWKDHGPVMVTATLDDGLGQGLSIIEKFAEAIGVRIIRQGLMQSAGAVMDACRCHQPDYLGMTVLQFDTEEELADISRALPEKTRIVAGGPVFNADPEFAGRAGVHYSARNVADFLLFMLETAI
ncbi:hypothetical protein LJC41_00340 [Desulfosarcina sp. OttesenSCG-928-G17]|nr:hypothetical protein [Desulfosarcina sp. OttesenSCG-928-G17]